ncbi:MAG: toll/interleukin-1 receptor domain-containing protein [Myxococcales bacterium]|nr:toll/interleukin-1 receptor domain-containing protein [Myxococcales bacterium]
MAKIYLSYQHADEQAAGVLHRHLSEQYGDVVFIRPVDGSGLEAVDFDSVVFEELSSARLMLLLVGEDVLSSPWVGQELELASSTSTPVLPVLLGEQTMPSLDAVLAPAAVRPPVRFDPTSEDPDGSGLAFAIRRALSDEDTGFLRSVDAPATMARSSRSLLGRLVAWVGLATTVAAGATFVWQISNTATQIDTGWTTLTDRFSSEEQAYLDAWPVAFRLLDPELLDEPTLVMGPDWYTLTGSLTHLSLIRLRPAVRRTRPVTADVSLHVVRSGVGDPELAPVSHNASVGQHPALLERSELGWILGWDDTQLGVSLELSCGSEPEVAPPDSEDRLVVDLVVQADQVVASEDEIAQVGRLLAAEPTAAYSADGLLVMHLVGLEPQTARTVADRFAERLGPDVRCELGTPSEGIEHVTCRSEDWRNGFVQEVFLAPEGTAATAEQVDAAQRAAVLDFVCRPDLLFQLALELEDTRP